MADHPGSVLGIDSSHSTHLEVGRNHPIVPTSGRRFRAFPVGTSFMGPLQLAKAPQKRVDSENDGILGLIGLLGGTARPIRETKAWCSILSEVPNMLHHVRVSKNVHSFPGWRIMWRRSFFFLRAWHGPRDLGPDPARKPCFVDAGFGQPSLDPLSVEPLLLGGTAGWCGHHHLGCKNPGRRWCYCLDKARENHRFTGEN